MSACPPPDGSLVPALLGSGHLWLQILGPGKETGLKLLPGACVWLLVLCLQSSGFVSPGPFLFLC